MNEDDFEFIETKLDVVLPEVFKAFMRQFPNGPDHRLECGIAGLPSNAELFAIAQMQQFAAEPVHDYFVGQPELRCRRFMNIGDQENPDFYCMVGDDPHSTQLWTWRSESYRDPIFVCCPDKSRIEYDDGDRLLSPARKRFRRMVWARGADLQSYFGMQWKLASQLNPFVAINSHAPKIEKGRIICRTSHPLRSIFDPITLQEWREYVERNPDLELDEVQNYGRGDEKSKRIVAHWSGRARWRFGNSTTYFKYRYGSVQLSWDRSEIPRNAEIEMLDRIARDLNASLY